MTVKLSSIQMQAVQRIKIIDILLPVSIKSVVYPVYIFVQDYLITFTGMHFNIQHSEFDFYTNSLYVLRGIPKL